MCGFNRCLLRCRCCKRRHWCGTPRWCARPRCQSYARRHESRFVEYCRARCLSCRSTVRVPFRFCFVVHLAHIGRPLSASARRRAWIVASCRQYQHHRIAERKGVFRCVEFWFFVVVVRRRSYSASPVRCTIPTVRSTWCCQAAGTQQSQEDCIHCRRSLRQRS